MTVPRSPRPARDVDRLWVPPRAPYTGPERRHSRRPGSRPRPGPAAAPVEPPRSQPDLPLEPQAMPPAAAEILPADAGLDALERALALQQEGRYSQVIEA